MIVFRECVRDSSGNTFLLHLNKKDLPAGRQVVAPARMNNRSDGYSPTIPAHMFTA